MRSRPSRACSFFAFEEPVRVRMSITNDAGIGRDHAGIAGLDYLRNLAGASPKVGSAESRSR
jgi:hypothetical protein